MSLTHGAISAMVRSGEGHHATPDFQPTVQIINIKSVGNKNTGSDRYRLILSDGEHYCNGMLTTQLNGLIHSGEITQDCLVRVDEYMINKIQNRMLTIVMKMEVLQPHEGRIGEPNDVDKTLNMAKSTAPASEAQPMYNRTNVQPSSNPYNSNGNSSGASANKPTSPSNPYGGSSYNNRTSPSSAPIIRTTTTSGVPITPIAQLNMYQNRWTIKARVTTKSDIRTWSNARGEGSLFSVELLDASAHDIKCTFFKDAVDKFYGMLEQDSVYTFSGGRIKVANQQYNTCKSGYEITFDANAEIHLVPDEGEIQAQIYDFVKISSLEQMEANKTVDLLAIVKSVGEVANLISKKSGNELTKCDLTLVDDSGVDINCTLWGEKAHEAATKFANQPVVAFRRLRLSDYGGKSCSTTQGTGGGQISPDIPEARALQKWWSDTGGQSTRSLSSSVGGSGKLDSLPDRKTVQTIKMEHLGLNNPDKPDYLTFKGTLTFIKKDKDGGAWYTACARSEEPCKNRFKVTQTTDGNWFCDKCQGTFPNCVRRWIFSGTVADDTSTTWVSFFNEQAEMLLGGNVTADQVFEETYSEEADQDKYDSYFARANHSDWVFKCRVKQENLGDETRVKASVVNMMPLDYAQESRDMLQAISNF
mmetsp:Transcript_2349/g.3412  ORF Transcript_2349/g.3412 Transcript_2349/m.3412 type:complete len:645 (+) Transcript_2349:183-2117(+)|eukprot:CAMPEP_0178922872 /NCGR_PEP_ID=MMETSP0786-20121207/16401_1 /TAXON_ID=186022 /ORGANISM="Thalassionema frauenfeldii, Strain CCMP 1798" /LENGTH=644 /DNA_ID=CAMNT_0020597297 /DNA_START=117 /DNA_END=2051 /DNA_ORIENTATION=+